MHPTQEHVCSVLESHHRALCTMYDRAWDVYGSIPTQVRSVLAQSNRTVAGVIWSLVTYEAARYFIPLGVVPRPRHQTIEFPVSRDVVIRFKKTNTKGETRNYQTTRAIAYDAGLPLRDVPERLRANVGWVPNETGTGVRDVLVSMRGPAQWCYSISINSSGAVDLFEFAEADDSGPIIRPRYDEAEEAGEGDVVGGE